MKLYTKATQSNKVTAREAENRNVAYRAATESIVLLHNDGTLPIAAGKLALYGAGAAHTIKGGTGSGEVNERHSVNILEGLKNAGFEITTAKWLSDYEEDFRKAQEEHAKVVASRLRRFDWISIVNPLPFQYPFGRKISEADIKSSNTDTCIYVVARLSGECTDRNPAKNDYSLAESEIENIKIVTKSYKKTIVVVNTGSSMNMDFLDEIEGISAVIYFCKQGCEGGTALADLLIGKVSPSGRLSETWAKNYSDIPFAEEYSIISGNRKYADYKEGIYVGYRYCDSFDVEPRFPFGYGLGYAEFSIDYSGMKLDGAHVNISVRVTNTGTQHSGKEVVQLYLCCPSKKLLRERQSLAAFAKSSVLAPGETQELTLQFDLRTMAAYDQDKAQFILEAGDYMLRVGKHSRATKACAVLELEREIVVSQHQNICPVKTPIEELKGKSFEHKQESSTLPRQSIAADAILTETTDYTPPKITEDKRVREILDKLSADEMVELCVGIGMLGGEKYLTVPGAGGYTTSMLLDKGLSNMVLSDGPAGVRLQKTSAITKKEKVKMVDAQLGAMEYLPKIVKKFLFGNPKKDKLLYQFTTAFPVGNAMAQTWNTELLEEIGKAAGREMVEYGVSVWLAPGMNIHRNPLCGRNYEYFSEDPLLTGKLAAAITRGAQSHEGCFVTIKHFVCNEQEEARQRMSSNVSERALREIYLRGFEIAIKEGNAGCVMTSYNRVNGEYAPNSYDLCTKVLRNEWGFDGLVMTDWFSTWEKRGLASNAAAIKSGNDLIMPGGKSFKKNVREALSSGSLSLEELRLASSNVIRTILASHTQKEFSQNR